MNRCPTMVTVLAALLLSASCTPPATAPAGENLTTDLAVTAIGKGGIHVSEPVVQDAAAVGARRAVMVTSAQLANTFIYEFDFATQEGRDALKKLEKDGLPGLMFQTKANLAYCSLAVPSEPAISSFHTELARKVAISGATLDQILVDPQSRNLATKEMLAEGYSQEMLDAMLDKNTANFNRLAGEEVARVQETLRAL